MGRRILEGGNIECLLLENNIVMVTENLDGGSSG